MLPHPKTMQTMTGQRWHELTIKTQRERLAMTTLGQTPGATYLATLRLLFVNAVRMLQPILVRRQEMRMAGDTPRHDMLDTYLHSGLAAAGTACLLL